MQAAIVAVGTELLGFERVESNSLRITEALERCGVVVRGKMALPDSEEVVADSIRFWLERVECVVLTGGLGPTADDVTREAVARALGEPLVEDADARALLVERFRRWSREMTPNQLRQALRPASAELLPNARGTAPGLWWSRGNRVVVALPGVPLELEALLHAELVPRLIRLTERKARESHTWLVPLLPEGEVDHRLQPLYSKLGREQVTVLAAPGIVRVRVTLPEGPAAPSWTDVEPLLQELLGSTLFRETEYGLEGAVVEALRKRSATLAVAESCTGGGIGARITKVPGSSEVFVGGVIAYANTLKLSLLGVPATVLERVGAVSSELVQEMARGVLERTGADWGLGVSGIAGPSGGSVEKPVGTVFLGFASRSGLSKSWAFRFPGERERIRQLAGVAALELLRRELLGLEGPVCWSLPT